MMSTLCDIYIRVCLTSHACPVPLDLPGANPKDSRQWRWTYAFKASGKLPAGAKTLEDGSVMLADGSIQPFGWLALRKADGTVLYADGSSRKPDGTLWSKGGKALAVVPFAAPAGAELLKDGSWRLQDGSARLPSGNMWLPDGKIQGRNGGTWAAAVAVPYSWAATPYVWQHKGWGAVAGYTWKTKKWHWKYTWGSLGALPYGASTLADGSVKMSDGSVQRLHCSSLFKADGSYAYPDGTTRKADNSLWSKDNKAIAAVALPVRLDSPSHAKQIDIHALAAHIILSYWQSYSRFLEVIWGA